MSKEELKQDILQVLERLPDETLASILGYLKQVEQDRSFLNHSHLQRILEEDQELLEKLAQ
ncbi:hypothetical protein [Cnuella takakiae]|nr:hypothetical protein [Cnuella takakiae]OLY90984.1 hypothetical protein BUE76_03010 [Cnuella takakiae]